MRLRDTFTGRTFEVELARDRRGRLGLVDLATGDVVGLWNVPGLEMLEGTDAERDAILVAGYGVFPDRREKVQGGSDVD